MTLWKISAKNNYSSIIKHKVMLLTLFVLSQSILMLMLNLMPIDSEWASVCREWIEISIGLN